MIVHRSPIGGGTADSLGELLKSTFDLLKCDKILEVDDIVDKEA